MKTSNNNNNIESNNQEFFTKGKKFRCIKSVKGDFTKGKVYEQSSDPTQWYGYFRNDKGILHVWPQPDNIAHNCDLYDMKPEDIDPRLYFEPVEDVKEAEGVQIGDKVRHNKHEEVATVTAIREAFVNRCDGYRYLYTLDFGQSVKGPFGVELNGGEFLREAFTPCTDDTEADTLADIISEAKRQECRSVSGLNYGPIKYLRDRVLYADNGKTTAENMEEYENNLHRVTTPDDYAGYLLSQYDVFVDETKVFCDLRRVFPSLTFDELCRLIRDHMDDNQQGDGIAAALVPDCVILSSADEYTRRQFLARHDNFNRYRADGWNPEQLRKAYDRDSLAVHFLLSEELYYTWENDSAARCLESVREIYPDTTAQELHNIRDKYADAVGEIYG